MKETYDDFKRNSNLDTENWEEPSRTRPTAIDVKMYYHLGSLTLVYKGCAHTAMLSDWYDAYTMYSWTLRNRTDIPRWRWRLAMWLLQRSPPKP